MPSKETIQWILNVAGEAARVLKIETLKGGMSSNVFLITIERNSTRFNWVLRQINNPIWLREEPDLVVHEVESLKVVSSLTTPTPTVIAFDCDGSKCGLPSVLMTKLEGTPQLKHPNMNTVIKQIAKHLIQIHGIKRTEQFRWRYVSYFSFDELKVPQWTASPKEWQKLIRVMKNIPEPTYQPVFIHRDYHPTNILWENNNITGIVDWVNACIGPRGIDIGHCRWNLAMLYGVDVAEQFLTYYEKNSEQHFIYDVYWDIVALFNVLEDQLTVYPGWSAFGLRINEELLRERMDQYMIHLSRQLD